MMGQLKDAIKIKNLKSILSSEEGINYLDIKKPVELPNGIKIYPRDSKEVLEAEQTIAICPRLGVPSLYTGNVIAKCFNCKKKIYHRPDIPKSPNLKLICIECAEVLLK